MNSRGKDTKAQNGSTPNGVAVIAAVGYKLVANRCAQNPTSIYSPGDSGPRKPHERRPPFTPQDGHP